jgi:hypothetical protein
MQRNGGKGQPGKKRAGGGKKENSIPSSPAQGQKAPPLKRPNGVVGKKVLDSTGSTVPTVNSKAQLAPVPRNGPLAKGVKPVIPNQPNTKALTAKVKMPKMKGDPSKVMNNRLKKKSPWFTSILDPLHGADCKIPDETGVETGTCQVVQRYTAETNANGVCGLRVICPYVNSVSLGAGQLVDGQNIQTVDPAATAITISWGSTNTPTGVWTANVGTPFDGIAELQSITNAHRVVSAALYVQPEASLANNAGELCMFARAFSSDNSPNYSDYTNYYKSVIMTMSALSQSAGLSRWFPIMREDVSFKSFFSTIATDMHNSIQTDEDIPPWQLGCIVVAEPDVTFRFTVVVNYEFVPTFNTLNVVDAAPSPQDATEVDLVETWVQEMPIAQPVASRVIASSPDSVSPSHGENDDGTGFGMFYNVVKEIAPFALSMLSLL